MKIQSLDSLTDTQNERDNRNIAIDRVGVRNLRYPVQILDKANSTQSTVAMVQLTVDLPHQYKGTHMSRFLEVLNDHGPVLHVRSLGHLMHELRRRLDAEVAHADFEFPFFLSKKAPATGAPGLMDYQVRLSAVSKSGHDDFVPTVIVPVTTLCPCSKAISAQGAHNQRGQVTFSVRSRQPIWIEDLIRLVESCASSELYSVLKRPDEKAVTERAYANPVFVEDLVRNIAARANAEPNILGYRVEAENFESIHNHNACALVEKNWAP